MHTLTMTAKEQPVIERALVIHILGVISALEHRSITIEEAETLWFCREVTTLLQRKAIRHEIVHILQLGRELRQIEKLIPHAVPKSLHDMRTLATNWLISNDTKILTTVLQ